MAVNCLVVPAAMDGLAGVTAMLTRVAVAAPVAKSPKLVKPVPVTVLVVDEDDAGAVHDPLYFRTISVEVFGLPTRSPGLAKLKVTL